MKYLIFSLILIFEVRGGSSSLFDKPVSEIIESFGYPSETHSVYTPDDYNLVVHRIPHGKHCKKENSVPVLLFHGIYENSLLWLFLGPENALGFLLADNCYDVWLGNARGNTFSRGHKHLNRSQAAYWEFSYHEIGVYDVSTTVDYIVNVTGQNEVLYVGYSQGGTVGLLDALYHPDSKIKAYFFLAPIVYFTYNPSILRALSPAEPILTGLTQTLIGNFEVRFNFRPLKEIEKIICSVVPEICYFPLLICGVDPLHVNKTALPHQLIHSSGISVKQILHYLQGYYLEFSEYNYGVAGNRKKYGTKLPPKYNMKDMSKPAYVYHSAKDLCADTTDIKKLAKELGNNLVKIHLIDNLVFDHLGFAFNKNAKELVYDVLIPDMLQVLN